MSPTACAGCAQSPAAPANGARPPTPAPAPAIPPPPTAEDVAQRRGAGPLLPLPHAMPGHRSGPVRLLRCCRPPAARLHREARFRFQPAKPLAQPAWRLASEDCFSSQPSCRSAKRLASAAEPPPGNGQAGGTVRGQPKNIAARAPVADQAQSNAPSPKAPSFSAWTGRSGTKASSNCITQVIAREFQSPAVQSEGLFACPPLNQATFAPAMMLIDELENQSIYICARLSTSSSR